MTHTSLFPRSVFQSFLGQDTEAQIQLVIVRVWVWAWLLESAEVTESSAVCRCELLNVTWSKNTQSNNTNMFHVSRAEKWNTRPLYQPINHFMLIRGNAQSVENTYHLLLLSFGRSLHAWIVTFHLILSMHPWPSSELLPWSGPSAASWFSFFPLYSDNVIHNDLHVSLKRGVFPKVKTRSLTMKWRMVGAEDDWRDTFKLD